MTWNIFSVKSTFKQGLQKNSGKGQKQTNDKANMKHSPIILTFSMWDPFFTDPDDISNIKCRLSFSNQSLLN